MSTTWVPMTRYEPRSWLLANGEVIEEPPLEQTSSGRKVRVTGSPDSFYAKDLEDLLALAAKRVAKEKGTTVFSPLTDLEAQERRLSTSSGAASLHLNQTGIRNGSTTAWWKFRHPDMPFSVTVVATMAEDRFLHQAVTVQAVHQTPYGYHGWNRNEAYFDTASNIVDVTYGLGVKQTRWQEFLRDNPLDWTADTIDVADRRYTGSRQAVEVFLKAVRAMEDLESIEWFDFRDLDTPAYMTLELYDTNVSAQFISELTDYVDGGAVEKAKELYDQLLASLKSCGVVLDASDNDFERALNSGTLTFTARNLPDKDEGIDHNHAIVVNIATGTMIVECANTHTSQNEIAEAWEEAKTVAALTGQEDELLAYAKEYARNSAKRRTKQILKERGA